MQGYRTVIFNLIMAMAGVVRLLFVDFLPADEVITQYFDAAWPVITIVGNLVMRKFTKGPIGVKDPNCK